MRNYVIDACAMIAYFRNEQGSDRVEELLRLAQNGSVDLRIHALNLMEIYYDTYRLPGNECFSW